jgi:hypothetical protein
MKTSGNLIEVYLTLEMIDALCIEYIQIFLTQESLTGQILASDLLIPAKHLLVIHNCI